MNKATTILTFLLLSAGSVVGQEKGLSNKKVSLIITNYIKSNYPSASRIKYYQEQVGDSAFVESEFKFKEDKYTLKFYKDSLVEIEIFIPFRKIPSATQTNIKSALDSVFAKYKILECMEVNPKTNPLYEINIKSYSRKSNGHFEVFFDKAGKLLRMTEILIKPIPSQF